MEKPPDSLESTVREPPNFRRAANSGRRDLLLDGESA
jgi:hypothetical protein